MVREAQRNEVRMTWTLPGVLRRLAVPAQRVASRIKLA
jgi:hypothetical protein